MATLGATYPTLLDVVKRSDDNGKITPIVEILNQTNGILDDMYWVEGNLPTGHRTTLRTSLPSATWRTLYSGVPYNKSTTAQITDTCGMLETYSLIDKDLADLNGNTAEFRLSEDKAFIEGMNQQMAQTLFYGNIATNPERFQGLAPRYNTLQTAVSQAANNVISAGGSGSANTSIWIVCWGDNTVHGIYPKGTQGGLQHSDVTTAAPVSDGAGGVYQAYQTKYQWKCGLTVRDWRYVARICNIDTTTSAGGLQSTTPPTLDRLLIRAMNKIPNMTMGRMAIYCNRAVKTWFDIQAIEKANLCVSIMERQGQWITTFRGIPMILSDQILNTEATIS